MTLVIEEKRKSIYAALLRYTPEAKSLRDRALDRIILVALLGCSESEPLRIGGIQKNIRFGSGSQGLRTDVIQQTLDRLINQGKVEHILHRTKHSYFLTETGFAEVEEAANSASALFEPVLARMLSDTSSLFNRLEGATVCRRFISECFARFGQQIAKTVTGELTREELIGTIDVRAAFQAAIEGISLSPEAIDSLEARCHNFLKSSARTDEELKFRLTQGYYVSQLLELDSAQFNPISDEAFRGAIFYIDTNVLLARLLSDEAALMFDEVVRLAARLGIQLRVTRETINETRATTIGRIEDIKAVMETVPEELIEKTRDQILKSFLTLRTEQPDITPKEFMNRFDKIPELLEELGIELDDRNAETIIKGRDVSKECDIVNKAAEVTRGGGKSESVQLHDVAHFLLVQEERAQGNKAWFLTRDRTLFHAASFLSDNGLFFCFSLIGFLQGISPFLESVGEESSLVDLFSEALERDVYGFSRDELFDIQELKLIGELHEDVLSTSPEQVVLAFDYVKTNVLNNKSYQQADHPKVALALKKFLASTANEKQKALQAEARRLQEEVTRERERRQLAEREAQKGQMRADKLETEIQAERTKTKKALSLKLATKRRELRLRAGLTVIGVLFAAMIWTFESEFARLLIGGESASVAQIAKIQIIVRFIGSLLLVLTSLPIVMSLRSSFRLSVLTFIIVVALVRLDLIGPEKISLLSGYFAFATPIALALLIVFNWKILREPEDTEAI
ncbi:MAG: hypothetical protein ACFFDT_17965 [Candidatus Hodarchaeota archaeon]